MKKKKLVEKKKGRTSVVAPVSKNYKKKIWGGRGSRDSWLVAPERGRNFHLWTYSHNKKEE